MKKIILSIGGLFATVCIVVANAPPPTAEQQRAAAIAKTRAKAKAADDAAEHKRSVCAGRLDSGDEAAIIVAAEQAV